MPRPSVKSERREQILDACEICLIRYGVEGLTLEQVAREADLARPLIRHNVGNREQLLQLTVKRFLERSDAAMQQLLDALPRENTVATLIEWLFDPTATDTRLVRLSDALITAGASDPELARVMRRWTRDFVAQIARVIAEARPQADEAAVDSVAAGISAAYFTAESVTQIGPMSDLHAACKAAAKRLAQTLEPQT